MKLLSWLFRERDRMKTCFRSLELSWENLPVRIAAMDSTLEIFNDWSGLVSAFADMFLDDGEIEQEAVDELCRIARWLDRRCRELHPPAPPIPRALDAAEELRRRIADLRAAAGGVYSPELEKLFYSLADYGEQVSNLLATGFVAEIERIDEYMGWFSEQTRALMAAEAEE